MAETAPVNPELIRWAITRSGLPREKLAETFPKLDEWQRGVVIREETVSDPLVAFSTIPFDMAMFA